MCSQGGESPLGFRIPREAAGKGPQHPEVFPGVTAASRARSALFMGDGETLQVLTQMLTEEGKQIEHWARHAHSMGLSVSLWRDSGVRISSSLGPGTRDGPSPTSSLRPCCTKSLRGRFPGCYSLAFLVFPFATSMREINSFARPYINRKASC